MLKKDSVIEWTTEEKVAFDDTKKVISQALVLTNPNIAKDFLIFTFASEHTIARVLLQKNSEGQEQPIVFYSNTLGGSELKYNIMEKHDFALIRALKEFRVYIMQSHIIAFVPNSVVKDILTQPGSDGRRGRWIVVLLEYDLEIKPTKLIKGMGLAKLVA